MCQTWVQRALLWVIFAIPLLFGSFLAASLPTAEQKSPSEIPKGKTALCLNMIVKNESRIIERCLLSVKDIIDCISICDTGSTDNTVEIIEQFMQKHTIPGKVHRHIWHNFGHNRTLSAQAAQKTLKELGFSLADTYLLLLDADMLLRVEADFNKESLSQDAYLLLQKAPDMTWYNVRLIRAALPWECLGVTHEYWTCRRSPYPCHRLSSLMIDDRNDGGCKADKFERDIRMLTQGLKDEPENARYMFYCAQSYKCLKKYAEAISWYKKRIEEGGWKEEVWYSKFMIGECYEARGAWDRALHWYMEAYQFDPARAEPLHKIAMHYRLNGQNELAYLFAKQGQRIPYPCDQQLFISHPVYAYLFDEELSIAAYSTQYKEEGFTAANRLLLIPHIPPQTKAAAYKNILWYVQNLKNAHFEHIKKMQKGNPCEKSWLPPSQNRIDLSQCRGTVAPIPFDEGFLMLVREVVQNDQRYDLHRFIYIDKDLQIEKISKPFVFRHRGFEYCSSMTIDHASNACLLTICLERETYACSVDLHSLRSLLEPLPYFCLIP